MHAATLLVELVRVRFHDQRPQAIGGFVEHRHPERFGSRQRSGVAPPSAVRLLAEGAWPTIEATDQGPPWRAWKTAGSRPGTVSSHHSRGESTRPQVA